jgi:hypothetical protein
MNIHQRLEKLAERNEALMRTLESTEALRRKSRKKK